MLIDSLLGFAKSDADTALLVKCLKAGKFMDHEENILAGSLKTPHFHKIVKKIYSSKTISTE